MNISKKKPRVLVVDDYPQVLRFVEINLKLHGYNVITAGSGEEALEQVRTARPDVLLLDIIMPGIDGCEVLKRLRCFSQVPVIAFSANALNYQEAVKSGADDFLPKPFQPDEMIKKIEALINR